MIGDIIDKKSAGTYWGWGDISTVAVGLRSIYKQYRKHLLIGLLGPEIGGNINVSICLLLG